MAPTDTGEIVALKISDQSQFTYGFLRQRASGWVTVAFSDDVQLTAPESCLHEDLRESVDRPARRAPARLAGTLELDVTAPLSPGPSTQPSPDGADELTVDEAREMLCDLLDNPGSVILFNVDSVADRDGGWTVHVTVSFLRVAHPDLKVAGARQIVTELAEMLTGRRALGGELEVDDVRVTGVGAPAKAPA